MARNGVDHGSAGNAGLLPQRGARRPWADTEIVLLVVMRARRIGYKRIARKLGRPQWAVIWKYRRLT